jgi:hypothetical protein
VVLALDVLEGRAAELMLEGDTDIVDAALLDDAGETAWAVQAKTKVEPYVWGPQQIAEVLGRWIATNPPTGAHFDFVTDGSLGPAVSNKLLPGLRRTIEGATTVEDRKYLAGLGLDPDEGALRRVSLHSRMPDGRTLLERESLRVLELRERSDPLNAEQARDVVWRLFGEVLLGANEAESKHRRIRRDTIAELVGVPVTVIDDAEPWSAALEARYREALASTRPDPAWTLLDLLAAERAPALSFVTAQGSSEPGSDQPRPATTLLERSDDVLLQGPAGAGKTTTLAQLLAGALERDLLPLNIKVGTYVAGELPQLLRRSLELATDRPLAPGAVSQVLDRPGSIVFLDGAGELLQEQRQAVIADMERLRRQHPHARLVLAAREATPFGRSGLSGFVLQGLTADTRREIASTLVPGGEGFVDEIEARLGEVASNPLLFTMAVGLYSSGTHASSRGELFDGFMQGLQTREEGLVLSTQTRVACEAAAFDLRSEGRYSADRWWWLDQLTASRAELIERGALSRDTPTGEQLLHDLEGVGLLRSISDTGDMGMLHDLFCDWLASEAVRRGQRTLPDVVPEPLEDATVFLAERGELSEPQMLAVAGNAIAAARAADALSNGRLDPQLTNAIWQQMCQQLAPDLQAPLHGLQAYVADDEPPWVYLAPPNAQNPLAFAADSPVICLAVGEVSSLSAAVDLWLAVVRLEVDDGEPGPPARPLTERDDLAESLEAAALRRASAVEHMINGLFPSLSHRILRAIGPSGIRGWLLPATQYPGPPGSGQTIEDHVLSYFSTADGTHIETVSGPEEIPDVEMAGQMSADSYLRTSALTAAQTSITKALTNLIPRYGD